MVVVRQRISSCAPLAVSAHKKKGNGAAPLIEKRRKCSPNDWAVGRFFLLNFWPFIGRGRWHVHFPSSSIGRPVAHNFSYLILWPFRPVDLTSSTRAHHLLVGYLLFFLDSISSCRSSRRRHSPTILQVKRRKCTIRTDVNVMVQILLTYGGKYLLKKS